MADQNDTRRRGVVQGLRDLADWLEATPAAPLPSANAGLHIDRAGFDALPDLGLGPLEMTGEYKSRSRHFGPVHYWVQAHRVEELKAA